MRPHHTLGGRTPNIRTRFVQQLEKTDSRWLLLLVLLFVTCALNLVKPFAKAQLIATIGADNLPWLVLTSGVGAGVAINGLSRLSRQAVATVTQLGAAALLLVSWAIGQFIGMAVPMAFVIQILGPLLISQLWTLSNGIYNAEQAKHLFPFIGRGASLGGIVAAAVVLIAANSAGLYHLQLASAMLLFASAGIVNIVARRAHGATLADGAATDEPEGRGGAAALRVLRKWPLLAGITSIITFAAISAALIDQQLNMALEEEAGSGGAVRIASFLARIQIVLSLADLGIQISLTRMYRQQLGLHVALLALPVCLGATGGLILVSGTFWTVAAARVVDATLRYSMDKTTREILFLPLPADLKYRVKLFADVTVERVAKGTGAVLMLILVQPWGLGLSWRYMSIVSLTVAIVWVASAVKTHKLWENTQR